MGFRTRTAWGLGLSLVLALASADARAASLRWKLKAGEALNYEMTEKTITTVSTGGAEVSKLTLTQTVDITWAVKSVDPQGVADLTHTINRVRIKIDSPALNLEFDSKDEKAPVNPLKNLFKVLVGSPFPFKMAPTGELTDVKIPANITKILKELGGAAGGSTEIFSEEGLKMMITQAGLIVPKEDVAEGKTWEQKVEIPSPPTGSMTLAKTFRYNGESPQGIAKIGVDATFTMKPTPGEDPPFTLKTQAVKGEMTFDNANGKLAVSTLNEKLEQVGKIQDNEYSQLTDRTVGMKLVPEGTK
ncbi:DUF6263 family protein [Singulisphaera sp. PoT]|uniref:DUF6263 family protein n=1 Tax=Singulisphaera sp. PoT TaxID=3411797 RepID=UPI003BF5739A